MQLFLNNAGPVHLIRCVSGPDDFSDKYKRLITLFLSIIYGIRKLNVFNYPSQLNVMQIHQKMAYQAHIPFSIHHL